MRISVMLAVLAVAVILIATQPRDVFWGSDSGSRFIQVESLLRHGSVAVEHRFPVGHHFVQIGNQTYSYWSPVFSMIAAPFYAMFGSAGFFVLPVGGTLLLIVLLPALSRGSLVVLATVVVFGTPILWYTIVFWEHTLAAALALAAFILAERDRPLLAGLVAAASTLLREEGYIVIAAIAVAFVIARRMWRPAALFVAGALVLLVPLWIVNFHFFGNPLGLHAAVYSSIAQSDKFSNVFPYLFEFTSVKPANVLLVLPLIALIVIAPFRIPATARAMCFALTAVGIAILTFLFLRSPAPIRETLWLQGLFPGIPLTTAMFLSLRRLWNEQRFRVVTVVIAVALTTISLNISDFGVIWGPRHFLWLLPLMIVLAADALADFQDSTLIVASAIVLIVCSFTIQVRGVMLLRDKLRFSHDLLQAVRSDPSPVVVTDVFWIPEELASAFYEKDFALVRNDAEMAQATKIVRGPFVFIAARQFRLLSPRGFAPIMPRVVRRRRIAGVDPMLDVMLLDVR